MSQLDILSDHSNKELLQIPESILQLTNLRMLYLEGNFLKTLPDHFFSSLPNLTWLDLRNNQLEDIPSTICDHKNLQTLLLQNNQLEFLPNEIGLVPTLQMLQVSGNPILYPPQEILDGGTKSIRDYLKKQFEKIVVNSEERLAQPETSNDEKSIIRGDSTSTSKASLSSVEPLKPSPRSATLSMATLPIITVKSLSKPKPPEENLNKDSTESIEKRHKVSRYCPKFTVKSQIVNGNKTIKTVMKLKAKSGSIDNAVLKELWLSKLKEILAEQERLIQQEKNLVSLNNWRMSKKLEPKRLPSEEEFAIPPYATDDDYDQILSKDELRKQLLQMGKVKGTPNPPPHIDKMMDDVLSQLKNIEKNIANNATPRTKIKSSEEEIKAILDLHKKIAALQLLNNTY